MKFSSRTTKSALVSALLLGSGVIAMTAAQDDGTQLDPAVPLDIDDDVDDNGLGSSDNALGSYGPYSNGLESTGGQLGGPAGCGFASDASNPVSCAKDYDDEIMIGVWLCEDDDMGSCGCADFYVSIFSPFPHPPDSSIHSALVLTSPLHVFFRP